MTYHPLEPLAWYGGSFYDNTDYEVVEPTAVEADNSEYKPDWRANSRWKRGLVLGRFLPPHRGHQFLVGFAGSQVDRLTIAMRVEPTDEIEGKLRLRWLKSLFPNTHIVTHQKFGTVNVLFSADGRHQMLAKELKAEFRLFDPQRATVPISATQIRTNPFQYWDFIPDCVRPYYAKVVRVVGADGAGKTTLCDRLARHFNTCVVPEFAAALAAANQGKLRKSDLIEWARQHLAARQALLPQANRLLLLDTDLLTVALWGERLWGATPPWIRSFPVSYDLTLILSRAGDDLGEAFAGERLSGSADEVFAQALQAIQRHLGWSVPSGLPA